MWQFTEFPGYSKRNILLFKKIDILGKMAEHYIDHHTSSVSATSGVNLPHVIRHWVREHPWKFLTYCNHFIRYRSPNDKHICWLLFDLFIHTGPCWVLKMSCLFTAESLILFHVKSSLPWHPELWHDLPKFEFIFALWAVS